MNEKHEWEDVDVQAPLPPTYGRTPGKPKKQRRKSADEIQQTKEQGKKVRRFGQICKCSFCGEQGHNTRTCKLREEAGVAASQNNKQGQETQANQDMNLSQLDDMIVDNSVRGNTSNAKKTRTKTSRKSVVILLLNVHLVIVSCEFNI